MRSWWIVSGLLLALFAGCVSSRPADVAAPRRVERPTLRDPAAQDVVLMDVAILEQPVGAHTINVSLWESADEQIIPPEQRAVLEDNGFRIGLIGGALPAELQNLLGSKRSCPDPRRIQTHAGSATALTLGGTLPACTFNVHEDGKATAMNLSQADCVLRLTPALGDGSRTRLQMTPEVLHGDSSLLPRPAADRSGWELQQHRPCERFPASGCDVSVSPGQYVIVGGRFERPETLGHRMFIRPEPNPVQYLLVLRVGRLQPTGISGAPEEDGSARSAPSLAQHAGSPTRP